MALLPKRKEERRGEKREEGREKKEGERVRRAKKKRKKRTEREEKKRRRNRCYLSERLDNQIASFDVPLANDSIHTCRQQILIPIHLVPNHLHNGLRVPTRKLFGHFPLIAIPVSQYSIRTCLR